MQAIIIATPDALCSPPAVARLGPEDSRQLPPTPFQSVPSTVGGDTLFGSLQPLHLQAGPLQQPSLAPQQAMVSAEQCAAAAESRHLLLDASTAVVQGPGPAAGSSGGPGWCFQGLAFRIYECLQAETVVGPQRLGSRW